MTTPARVPGKYGRKPALMPAGIRTLDYYAAGPLPTAPASVAVPPVADWNMDGNSEYGDCGVAGADHYFKAAASLTGESEQFPAAAEVVSYYLAYTGGQDSGVVLSDFLAHVKASGFYGHTVSAYAPVAVQDIPALQFAISAYAAAYVGITVTDLMEQAFSAGQPWDLAAAGGKPLGGHCIILCGYDSQWLYGITWGSVVKIAYPAWHLIGDEAWAIIGGELTTAGGNGHGINLAALQADLGKLDPPAPPQAGLLAELAGLIRDVAATADRDVTHLLAWLSRHGL